MPDMPAAEREIDTALVRGLLRDQAADAVDAEAPLQRIASGWDCEMWRLGAEAAVRLPRRDAAAALVENEQRWLPQIAATTAPSGIAVPLPRVGGRPARGFPWPWSVVPWFDGARGMDVPRAERSSWAQPLARLLTLLHSPAPTDHPVNPYRGVPLRDRDEAVTERLASLARRATRAADVGALAALWADAVRAPAWPGPPLWLHGDLHPGNLVADASGLVAVIDWGDITAGDPAYDLAIAWLAFDAHGRTTFRAALPAHDVATWRRARGWAAAVAALLLEHSDDNPDYAAFAEDAARELAAD